MKTAVNLYGDNLRAISNQGYGCDISSQRLDELDIETLGYITTFSQKNNKAPVVLDLGCGSGLVTQKFSEYGAKAYGVDIAIKPNIEISKSILKSKVNPAFIRADIREIDFSIFDKIDILYSQRLLHYFSFYETLEVLKKIKQNNPHIGFFLSFSGLNSELGNHYADKHKKVEQRFSPLYKTMQFKHSINEPVCLYTCDDVVHLMQQFDSRICKVWESNFRNIKTVLID